MGCCSCEPSQHCHNSPTDQYPSKPDSRTNLVQQEVARYLENEITEKEDSRDQPVLLACNSQFFVHGQCRKSDFDPVNVIDHEQHEHDWDDPRPQLADCSSLDCESSNCRTGSHAHLLGCLAAMRNVVPDDAVDDQSDHRPTADCADKRHAAPPRRVGTL